MYPLKVLVKFSAELDGRFSKKWRFSLIKGEFSKTRCVTLLEKLFLSNLAENFQLKFQSKFTRSYILISIVFGFEWSSIEISIENFQLNLTKEVFLAMWRTEFSKIPLKSIKRHFLEKRPSSLAENLTKTFRV